MFRKLTFLRGRRLLHGGRETGPRCGRGAGVCASVSSRSAPVWAGPEEGRRGLPSSCLRIPPLCKLPRGDLPGRTPGRGSPGSQCNSWNSRFSGHTHAGLLRLVPRDGQSHKRGCGMWRVLAAVASLPHSCSFLCPAGLVFLLCLGDSSKKSMEPSARCGQLGHLKMGVFIGSGPGSLWLTGWR